jgi:hypothetical protein
MRLRNSVSSASGTFTRKGRIAFLSAACSLRRCVALVWVMVSIFHSSFLLNPWCQYGNQKIPLVVNLIIGFSHFNGMIFVQNFNALGDNP